MDKVTNPMTVKFSSAKIISCLMLLLPLIATFLISYILSSWNWHLIAMDYYRKITESQGINSECNLFIGNWTPSSYEPYYTNTSKCIIENGQNCMMLGRPDTEFMRWRWKPADDCELPRFNATLFLELMRGKTMAFIGDSLARNHVQSLTCMLTQPENPMDIWNGTDWKVQLFRFVKYNFTIQSLWSAYLVKDADTSIYARVSKALYLDEADEMWTSYMHTFDYVIISSAHWFLRPLMYYRNGKVVGCYDCKNSTIVDLGLYYGYRSTFKTAYQALLDSDKFKGSIFLRTYSPQHFENGKWYANGSCSRTSPTEIGMEDDEVKFYRAAIDELIAAEKIGKKKGLKFGILDLTRMMAMRPDGHPNRYGPGFGSNKADCLHWCLPGPIDTWNEIFLQLLLR